ncbi:MAG: hypothetical protein ACO29P_05705 [Bacteroidia bacterium]
MTKKKIIKEIQQRINAAMINGKDEIALAFRDLQDVITSDNSTEDFESLYSVALKRNSELWVKLQKYIQND